MAEGYDWRHGWVPLTMHAALLKAHGRHAEAERLLEAGRKRRRARRARRAGEFVTPHPAHRAEHAARRHLRSLTDDEVSAAMGSADEGELALLEAELERRDRAERKATAARERRAGRRQARDAAREAHVDRLLADGHDDETAYRVAYGITEDQQRRQEAVASLRSAGYRGRGLDELIRHAYADHAQQEWHRAEDATRGSLLNKAGRARDVDPRSLFTGTDARARKYASRELLDYWQEHGRLSAADFRAGVLGGDMQHKGAAAYA